MKTRFVVPAAVAMALHAVLLFGFRSHPNARVFACPLTPPARPPDTIEVIPPPENPEESGPAIKDAASAARHDQPEPPAPTKFSPITIPLTDRPDLVPHPTGPLTAKLGTPEGNEFGGQRIGPVTIDHLDNTPRATLQVAPIYPYEARISGRPGEVLVEFVVNESGRVVDPHVLHSNDPIFEASTLRAVAKWRFEPGRRHGQIVRFRMAVPVAFAVTP